MPPPDHHAIEFTIAIDGIDVGVRYVKDYSACLPISHFEFTSLSDPRRPIPISETGYLSNFAYQAIVDACGSPEAYAKAFADARMRGDDTIWVQPERITR